MSKTKKKKKGKVDLVYRRNEKGKWTWCQVVDSPWSRQSNCGAPIRLLKIFLIDSGALVIIFGTDINIFGGALIRRLKILLINIG